MFYARSALALLLCAIVSPLGAQTPARTSPELQAALAFEGPFDGDVPRFWRGGPPDTITRDDGVVHSGAAAVKMQRGEGRSDSATTLGLLIPPSILMIVYGVAANVSIGELFLAGVLPGILLAALFSGYIVLYSLARPGTIPLRDEALPLMARLKATAGILPACLLILMVMGSIYLGLATPTESAARCSTRFPSYCARGSRWSRTGTSATVISTSRTYLCLADAPG